MFPIPWNKLFRKKDGSITTLDDAIENGGTPYTLPTASAETKGGIKVGSGLSIDENGVLSASGGGGITLTLIDGTTITGGTQKEISNVDLTDHKGFVVFARYPDMSSLVPFMFKKIGSTYEGGKVCVHSGNSGVILFAEKLLQYNNTTHKLFIGKNNWVEFANDAVTTHVNDSANNMCVIEGIYYYD